LAARKVERKVLLKVVTLVDPKESHLVAKKEKR
jgi:hypothetical protein